MTRHQSRISRLLWLITTLWLAGCTSLPDGVNPVREFDVNRYLGTWYEIARLDHSFERGLTRVTANYTLRDDDGVRVLNRGFSEKEQAWSEAEGKAFFVSDSTTGHLKVSFFGPFYGAYGVFYLDDNYQNAFVSGPSHKYLWLLSRTAQPDQQVIDDFVMQATALGFDTTNLIFVDHQNTQ